MAREMPRNNPLVMQGVRRLVANVVGRGFGLRGHHTYFCPSLRFRPGFRCHLNQVIVASRQAQT